MNFRHIRHRERNVVKMDITELTVHELIEKLEKKELTSTEIIQSYVDRIKKKRTRSTSICNNIRRGSFKTSKKYR